MGAAERRRRAYEAGFRGDPAPDWITDADTLAAYDRGLNDADLPADERQGPVARSASSARSSSGGTATRTRKPSTRTSTSSSSAGTSSSSTRSTGPRVGAGGSPLPSLSDVPKAHVGGVTVDDGAGFLLGLFVFALMRAFLQGGTTEARQWLAAKFLNHGSSKPAGTGAGSGGSTTSKTAPIAPSATKTAPLVPGNFGGGS